MNTVTAAVHAWCERRFGVYTTEGANNAAIDGFERGCLDRQLDYTETPRPDYHDCLPQYRDDWERGYREGYSGDYGEPEF